MRSSIYKQKAALLIGIDRYSDSQYPDLGCAVADALLISETLKSYCGFESSEITLLLNEEATLKNIRRQAESIARKIRESESQLLMFFAGHGETISILGGNSLGYLVPHDGDGENVFSTCCSMQELITLSQIITARHALFLLDCCFSGLVGVTTRGKIGTDYVDKMLKYPARQILTAGMSKELAREDSSIGHGLFTHCLCEVLSNPPEGEVSYLTASNVYPHLVKRMTRLSRGLQTPQFRQLSEFGEGDNIFFPLRPKSAHVSLPHFSASFNRLYCDSKVFDSFSRFNPISFRRLLPFQQQDKTVDKQDLIEAEEDHLHDQNDDSRCRVVDAYLNHQLLQKAEAANLKTVIDFYDTDFFEVMGLIYSNAGMHKCALRWYHELIRKMESEDPNSQSDQESVYASVGYSLYSLGFFEEAIAWSKSCIGPLSIVDVVCQRLIAHEIRSFGGKIIETRRAGNKMKYFISSRRSAFVDRNIGRLQVSMKAFSAFQEVEIAWLDDRKTAFEIEPEPEGYLFRAEFDGGSFPKHKMNLIFSVCAQTDVLLQMGYKNEAKRLLSESVLLEPNAEILWERLQALI